MDAPNKVYNRMLLSIQQLKFLGEGEHESNSEEIEVLPEQEGGF